MGLIPPADCGVLAPPDTCTTLFDVGEAILASALIGLEQFIDPSCGEEFHSFVSMGKPAVLPDQDFLAVWLQSFGPQGGPHLNDCASGIWPQFAAQWQVELWEHCYPSVNDVGQLPQPDELHAINAHVYAHGLATYNAAAAAWYNKQGVYPPIGGLSFGPMLPIQPTSKATGWTFSVTATF